MHRAGRQKHLTSLVPALRQLDWGSDLIVESRLQKSVDEAVLLTVSQGSLPMLREMQIASLFHLVFLVGSKIKMITAVSVGPSVSHCPENHPSFGGSTKNPPGIAIVAVIGWNSAGCPLLKI